MMTVDILKLSFQALKANKIRSFLTMLGIIIGVAAVIILISLGTGLQNYITQQFEQLGANTLYVLPGQVGQEGGGFSQGAPNFAGSKLTVKDSRDLRRIGFPIVDTSSSIEMPVSVKYSTNSKYIRVHGVEENFLPMSNIKIALGRGITKADVDSQRKIIVLGDAVREKLFGDKDPLQKKILVGDFRYDVVGIIEKKGGSLGISMDDLAFIPITCAQTQFNQDNVQSIMIGVADQQSIEDAKSITKRFFSKKLKEDEFSVVDQASLLNTINQIIGVLTSALGGIAAISLLVGGIGIMNIMLVSVTERTKEIGLRKAVGAKSTDILFQFLAEAVALCLFGGVIGILLGILGSLAAQKLIPTTVPLWSVLLAFGFSATVGIVFGVAPAAKAAKLDPINALRYE